MGSNYKNACMCGKTFINIDKLAEHIADKHKGTTVKLMLQSLGYRKDQIEKIGGMKNGR